MRVRSETIIENRTISVELDDSDGESEFPAWKTWALTKRFKALSNKADQYVVFYLAQSHLITTETAKSRMEALQRAAKALHA